MKMIPFFVLGILLFHAQLSEAADPVTVASSDLLPDVRQPRVAVNEAGHIFVAFGANEDVFVCQTVDQGETFSTPVNVGHITKLALGMRRGPRIAAGMRCVVVTAISHESGDLMASRSNDAGKTWSGFARVNDDPGSAREGLHGMAMGPDGLLFCAWLDLRHGGTQIYGASSSDNGRTWSGNRRIYASPSGTVCECCHPSVAISSRGTIYVMWRNLIDGNRDMYVAKSGDNGQSFDPAEKIGTDSWKLNACPMDGGDLAVSAGGSLSTVWRRERQIFTAGLDDPRERRLGQGEQPSVAATGEGCYFLWLTRRGADLVLSSPSSKIPTTLADSASDPDIAVSRSGNGPVVAVWESGKKPNTSIMAATLAE